MSHWRLHSLIWLLVFCLSLAWQPTEAQEIVDAGDSTQMLNPLTGQPVDNPLLLERRPLLVKISNFPAYIRPQHGLNSAEVVWEHLLAGGVTRFTAVFLTTNLDHIGPVRSARLLDFELTRIYRGLLAYSGMSIGTTERLNADPLMRTRELNGTLPCPAMCRFPQEGLAAEHTLYVNGPALRRQAEALDRDTRPETLDGMTFTETAPVAGISLDGLKITYRQTEIEWQYAPGAGRWLRFQDGEAHFDAHDSQQISAANVVVLEADHIEQPFTAENYWGPGNYAFSVDLTGSGRIFLLRDGRYSEGEWRRADADAPLEFYDLNGERLPFRPGNTFFNLVPRWVGGYELTFLLAEPLTAVIATDGQGANLRLGPGSGYTALDVGYPGDTFQAIGRDRAGEWLQLRLPDNSTLWASRLVLRVDDDIMRLPVSRPTNE